MQQEVSALFLGQAALDAQMFDGAI